MKTKKSKDSTIFLKRIADGFILCMFFGISILCSGYIWFPLPTDVSVLCGIAATFFSFLFAAVGNIIIIDLERREDKQGLIKGVKNLFLWLGMLNLSILIISSIATDFPSGWMSKVLFLLIMGIGNQMILKYQYRPRYIALQNYQDEAA